MREVGVRVYGGASSMTAVCQVRQMVLDNYEDVMEAFNSADTESTVLRNTRGVGLSVDGRTGGARLCRVHTVCFPRFKNDSNDNPSPRCDLPSREGAPLDVETGVD